MSNSRKIVMTIAVFIWGISFCPKSVFAAPSAKDLLQACQKNTHVDCNTQHLVYKTTTIIQKPGEAPVTVIQRIEIYKKKPGNFRIITDDGTHQTDVISRGDGYLYVKDPTTGKFMPMKSPLALDPFQDMVNTLSDFDTAEANEVNGHYEVTVRGGKLPKSVDHATVTIDPGMNVVTHMEGFSPNGSSVMHMDAVYQKIGSVYHPKNMHTEANSGKFNVVADMEVLKNEVNQEIQDSIFAVK